MPCTFAVDAADLGYLDPLAAHQQHLAAGTQVELPLWLTKAIASKQMVRWLLDCDERRRRVCFLLFC
jgi:hypothetical protein